METISVIKNDVTGVLLIEAMTASPVLDDILKTYSRETETVNVELKINGYAVPIVEALEGAWGRLRAHYKQDVIKKAKELLTTQALEKIEALRDILEECETKVKDYAESTFPDENY